MAGMCQKTEQGQDRCISQSLVGRNEHRTTGLQRTAAVHISLHSYVSVHAPSQHVHLPGRLAGQRSLEHGVDVAKGVCGVDGDVIHAWTPQGLRWRNRVCWG